MRIHCSLLAFGLVTIAAGLAAADTPSTPKTLMAESGKLLFSDDFSSAPGKEWTAAKGRWEAVHGALQGAEVKSQNHGAVLRHALPFHDAVIQFSFKLDGTKGISLSINDPKGHNSRVSIAPNSFAVRKDDHDHEGPDKGVLLETKTVTIEPGKWHTMTIEEVGPELLARLDDGPVAFGSNPAIDVQKSNLGLTVAGESASFKNFSVWEASPKSDWPATKARLTADRTAGKTTAK